MFKLVSSSLSLASLLATLTFSGVSLGSISEASADSCWWHNGSLMRLQARGSQRWFSYERPRAGLSVRPGTLLFNGEKRGNYYTGTARTFSRHCPGAPNLYNVSGPVARNQTKVTVSGTRQVFKRCRPTGRYVTDRLVFTYSHRC
jgi:hypothetical protein